MGNDNQLQEKKNKILDVSLNYKGVSPTIKQHYNIINPLKSFIKDLMGIVNSNKKFSFRVRNTPFIFGVCCNNSYLIKLDNGYLIC